MSGEDLKNELNALRNPEKEKILSGFFKSGKGEYGEGDKFLGITVPVNRKISKQYYTLPLDEIEKVLRSEIHEHRLGALMALVEKYKKCKQEKEREQIVNMYLRNCDYINNWDLVDLSAPQIMGEYLLTHDRSVLKTMALSNHLWKQRISIISTFTFIKNAEYADTIAIADILLMHKHDLIQKAVGWMLREMGERGNYPGLIQYLDKNYKVMPRTTLRYAIEKLEPQLRAHYMKK